MRITRQRKLYDEICFNKSQRKTNRHLKVSDVEKNELFERMCEVYIQATYRYSIELQFYFVDFIQCMRARRLFHLRHMMNSCGCLITAVPKKKTVFMQSKYKDILVGDAMSTCDKRTLAHHLSCGMALKCANARNGEWNEREQTLCFLFHR